LSQTPGFLQAKQVAKGRVEIQQPALGIDPSQRLGAGVKARKACG
jgi:hypothetical protein